MSYLKIIRQTQHKYDIIKKKKVENKRKQEKNNDFIDLFRKYKKKKDFRLHCRISPLEYK